MRTCDLCGWFLGIQVFLVTVSCMQAGGLRYVPTCFRRNLVTWLHFGRRGKLVSELLRIR